MTDSQRKIGDASGDAGGKVSKFSSFIKVGLVGALTAGVASVGALTAAIGGLGLPKWRLIRRRPRAKFGLN
nr:hypothetical protein P5664_05810 [Bacillus subtilis]